MALKIACIVDPVPTLIPGHDTSLAILQAAEQRGHEVHVCEMRHLSARDGKLFLRTTGLNQKIESALRPASEFSLIFMRKDPPVDRAFLQATYLLDLAGVPVWNSPSGLREASEKFFALRFPGVFPPTLVSQERGTLEKFMDEMGGEMVLKPVDGYAGKGVFIVKADDPNRAAILETSTGEGRYPVLVQKYLPEIKDGDKRIILLDGKPLGAMARFPKGGEFRANMAAGGTTARYKLRPRDHELIEAIRPGLEEWGLHFVGLDVIGDYITEVNVTSPTGIQEISGYEGRNLSVDVVTHWEKLYG